MRWWVVVGSVFLMFLASQRVEPALQAEGQFGRTAHAAHTEVTPHPAVPSFEPVDPQLALERWTETISVQIDHQLLPAVQACIEKSTDHRPLGDKELVVSFRLDGDPSAGTVMAEPILSGELADHFDGRFAECIYTATDALELPTPTVAVTDQRTLTIRRFRDYGWITTWGSTPILRQPNG